MYGDLESADMYGDLESAVHVWRLGECCTCMESAVHVNMHVWRVVESYGYIIISPCNKQKTKRNDLTIAEKQTSF